MGSPSLRLSDVNGGKGTFQDIFSLIVDKPLGYKPGVVGLILGFSSLSMTVIA